MKKKNHEKNFFLLWQFYTRYEQQLSNLRPLLSMIFPQGFQKSEKFGHLTLGSAGKKTFKQSKKIREKTFFAAVISHLL